MILDLQFFGGRGASSSKAGGSGAAGGSSENDFIERLANDLAREYTAADRENGVAPYSNSDLQAEANAKQYDAKRNDGCHGIDTENQYHYHQLQCIA